MANATANVQLNVTGNAQQQLQKTQQAVTKLQDSFSKLKNVVGGLAIGSLITNVLRSADAMDDLAKATGISIATIDGLGAALKQSGGEAEDAGTIIAKLSQSIEEGRQGTAKAEYQFGKLGISIAELRNLSDEDVLRKTLEALAKMPAGAERTALAIELLGKKAKTIDWTNLNGSLEMFIQKAQQAEPGTKALAQLYDNLQGIGKSFTQQLTIGGTNFAETLAKLTENTDAIAKSLVDLTRIITILGAAFTIFNKILPGIRDIRDGIASITKITAFAKLGKDLDNITNNFKRFLGILPSEYKNIQSLGFALTNVGVLLGRLTGYGLVIYGLGEAFKALTGTINPVTKALEFLRDIGVVVLARLKKEWDSLVESFKAWTELLGLRDAFEFVAQSIIPLFSGPIDWLENKLMGLSNWWKQTVKEAEKVLGIQSEPDQQKRSGRNTRGAQDRIDADKRKDETAKAQATELEKLADAIRRTTTAFIKQQDAQLVGLQIGASYTKMSEEQRAVIDAQRSVYDNFTNKIDEYKDKISELPPEQEKLKSIYLGQIAVLEKLRDQYMINAGAAVVATQKEINAQQDLQAELEKTFQKNRALMALDDLRAELDLMGLSGDELERQQRLLETQRTMRDSVADAVEKLVKLEQDYEQGTISEEKYNREKSALEATLETARLVAEGKLKIDEEYFEKKAAMEESYAEGAAKAMKDIAEQFKPINMAQEAIQKGWSRIGDAIDTFVETGKFSFSDFARSVIADLAKMIAKALIFKAISAALGAFGLKIPGLAAGGPVEAGKAYMVGEKGPELFVPPGSGKIVPNDKLGNKNSGPVNAPVNNTYNTYNINALDAKSVAQMFAENRKAIFGANKMAEREMSYAGAR